jgi:hypothetical protein
VLHGELLIGVAFDNALNCKGHTGLASLAASANKVRTNVWKFIRVGRQRCIMKRKQNSIYSRSIYNPTVKVLNWHVRNETNLIIAMIKQLATNCPTLFHAEIEKERKLLLAIFYGPLLARF